MSKLTRRTLVASSLLPYEMIQAQAKAPTFKMAKGVATYPWFSQAMHEASPSRKYQNPPYMARRAIPTLTDLKHMKQSGLDHIRLPVDPAPYLAGEPFMQRQLLGAYRKAVELTLQAGLNVVFNLHPSESTHYWHSRTMMNNEETLKQYLAMLSDLARAFKDISPTQLCFEPMNEPKFPPNSREWERVQVRLHGAIRAHAPAHSIILSGAEGSLIHGLSPFDPSLIKDENTFFTLHFYEPFHFTHQGGIWTGTPTKYLAGLPWPASAGSKDEALTQTARSILRQVQDPQEQTRVLERAKAAIDQYFERNNGMQMVNDHFGVAFRWAQSHGIAKNRLYIGEFGVVRSDGARLAAEPQFRAQWIEDLRKFCETHAMPWCFWNFFDVMGLVKDDIVRAFDPPIVHALGLKMP